MINTPTWIFGPTVPEQLESVGVSFVSAPTFRPDLSVAVLSAERYVRQNYAHVRELDLMTSALDASGSVVSVYGGTNVLGMYTAGASGEGKVGGWTLAESTPSLENYRLRVLMNPITLEGLYLSKAGSWLPVIKPGCVWREHTVKAEEFDAGTTFDAGGVPSSVVNQSSWLARSGLIPGDEVFLIYTVPEHAYTPTNTSTSTTYPGTQSIMRRMTEYAGVVAPRKLSYRTPIKTILAVTVNGSGVYSGRFDGTVENSFLKRIDHDLQIVELNKSLSPSDQVLLEIETYSDRYIYSGFRHYNNFWYAFDANPEYGHFVGDYESNTLVNSSTALLNQVTLYLIPSAYVKVTNYPGETSTRVTLRYETAFNWGETHFVRHILGQNDEEISTRQQDSTINTWGYAVAGRNYYDEQVGYSDDVFSLDVPSMMPLGKVVMAAPAGIGSVQVADVRERGGGVPIDFPFTSVEAGASGIDTLRGYWDLGTYDGAAIKEGGVVEVVIDSSMLQSYTQDEIRAIVESYLPPGIDYELIFRSGV